ncbi:MAG: S8 family serine peptidase, partial [Planctomycetota bacterium]
MSSAIFRRLLPVIFGLSVAVDIASAQPANRGTSVQRLQQLEARLGRDFDRDHAAAAAWARQHGELMREEHADGRITALISLRDGHPHTLTTLNATAADSVSADDLWPGAAAGLALNGAGVRIHEWDGGEVRLAHVELAGAVTWADDTAPGLSSHATHVAGTMVALGVDPTARGMAFAANIDAYDFYDDTAEMAAAAAAGARLSNHSYGWIRGWYRNPSTGDWYWYGNPSISRSEDARFGFYDATSQAWDDITYNAPFYLICKSSGNDRNDSHNGGHWFWDPHLGTWVWSAQGRKADGGRSGYDSIGQQGCAKNILTVGAVEDVAGGYTSPADVVMTSFSGWGPTDDGRIKPDLVANGMSLHSPVALSDVSYSSLSGTSMSSPNVTGSLALLIQHYRETHGGADMRAATLKGLAIHTASECGTDPGPDYEFGWGLLDAHAAAEHISRDQAETHAMQELSLAQGQTIQQVWTSDGVEPIRATICWTDPAGNPVAFSLDPTDSMLVNDLDLRIIAPDGTVYEPWNLDPANPSAAATRGDNARDNVEMIVIDAPLPGNYPIEITHK